MKPALGALLAALLAAGALFAGHSLYSQRAVRVAAGEASPPSPQAETPIVMPDAPAPAPPVIPEHLPQFTLNDADGAPTPIANWRGKSLIINFWATWCAPCRHEIPLLETLNTEWTARGFTVIGIAVDHRAEVAAFAREFKIAYPLLVGEQDALDVVAQFGVDSPAFPFTVFTDRRGRVVTLFLGELHRAQADSILSVVQSLNLSRLDMPAAQREIETRLEQIKGAGG